MSNKNDTQVLEIPMEEIRERNRRNAGYWFSGDTMRFFSCRLPQVGYRTPSGDILFWTSERCLDGDRLYSVRRMDFSGDIKTEGAFQAFRTRSQALAEIRRLLRKEDWKE